MWSCCEYIGSKPLLHQLLSLRLDSRELKVMDDVCITWRKLGILLEVDYSVLTAIEKNNMKPEDCCIEMLHKWLSGEAVQPITWERLIKAIEGVGLYDLVNWLETLLS